MLDSAKTFGLVSILFHWITALSFIGLFGLGWYMVTLDYYNPLYTTLPHLHKSLGILMLVLVSLQVIWRLTNHKPEALPDHRHWEIMCARITHLLLWTGVMLVLFSGYLISSADNSGIMVFDWFRLPSTITSLPEQEDNAGVAHRVLAYGVLVIAFMHAAAAFKHHLVDRDMTLKRMLGIKETQF